MIQVVRTFGQYYISDENGEAREFERTRAGFFRLEKIRRKTAAACISAYAESKNEALVEAFYSSEPMLPPSVRGKMKYIEKYY